MYTIQKGDKKMDTNFEVNMNEYLPLRDVVFNTLRQAILRGELKPGEDVYKRQQQRDVRRRDLGLEVMILRIAIFMIF